MKKILLVFFTIYMIILLFEIIYLFQISSTETIIYFLKLQLLCLYLFVIYSTIKILQFRWTSIYIFFLLTLGIFIFSRLFLDIFNLYDYRYFGHMINIKLDIETEKVLISYLILALTSIHQGVIISTFIKYTQKIPLSSDFLLEKVGTYLFYFGLPGTIIKNIIQLKYLLSYGYLALYMDNTETLSYPLWINLSGLFFLIGFIFILASLPKKKKVLIVLFIFVVFSILKLIGGIRGGVIVTLFYLIWYYYQFYSIKDIKIYASLLIGVGLIILSQFIGFFRSNQDFSFHSILDIFVDFFSNAGGSLGILASMIYYKNSFINEGFPYILNPFVSIFAPSSQSVERIENTLSLADQLSYFLSSSRYLAGEGVGTSFLGELYDLGPIGYGIGSFLLGFFIVYMSKIVIHSRLALILSYHIVMAIIWMPRGGYFPSFLVMSIVIFFYASFLFFKKSKRIIV